MADADARLRPHAQPPQVVGQAVFNPLGIVVYAMLYLDMRVRREGLDLERRLEAR